jgi:cbb3-type cytochrome oxidase maturation protein
LGVFFILISVSIPIAGIFLLAFIYSARKGQFDDPYTPSMRMLKDDEINPHPTKPTIKTES